MVGLRGKSEGFRIHLSDAACQPDAGYAGHPKEKPRMLDIIEAESGPDPAATILILHGLGADGNDFVPIAGELQLEAVGPVRFIFPHAPVMPVTINGGYRMRAWYDILSFDEDAPQDEAGLRRSQQLVEALLAREKERGIAAGRIVLAGFSQGCAMALLTGLRHRERLAGIVGLSGYLPLAGTTERERSPANLHTPIFLAHGTHDEVVALDRAEASRDALQALGHPVEWHEYLMGHAVSPLEIEELNAFLVRVLSPGGEP
jgi:phospholipase/carboxylesterase